MAKKYLKHFPKPLLKDLITGRWLPVIGAGMSLNAVFPPDKKMPLWSDLGARLGEQVDDFVPGNPLDAISAFEHEFGRSKLIEQLSELLLIKDARPGNAHKEFCSIPFDLVCTTNFDFLLERQYDQNPGLVYPVIDEEQLSINVERPGTVLLKLHGDLRHPSRLVVTEADYDSFLSKYPLLATYMSNQLITKTAVLIGYSLDDPDFRQLWSIVGNRLGKMRRNAYAIMVGARSADIARFERRNVKVINLPGSRGAYGQVLADAFSELTEYVRENVISVSRVTEERPLRELSLPRDAATRLCFFSVPLDLLSFYRDRVFPSVEEIGFVPVTATDVISPGDNISAKIDALIDRSAVIVCDVSSDWTRAELRVALSRIKERRRADSVQAKTRDIHVIVVLPEGQELAADLRDVWVVHRRDAFEDIGPAEFVDSLISILTGFVEVSINLVDAEPRRLLEAKEYRAAVISAMSLLEVKLRQRLRKEIWSDESRFPLRRLFETAVQRQILPEHALQELFSWLKVRNVAAHSTSEIDRRAASNIVNGVYRLLAQLQG